MILTRSFEPITVNDRGEEIKRETKQAQYFTEDLGNGVTLDIVAILGDAFMMGSPKGEGFEAEKPQHEVTIQSFFMGKYPVTQAQWRAVASLPKVDRSLKSDPSEFKGDDLPVECVSWHDAVEFCARLSTHTGREYRLPSEAEWEYTCRAGTTTPFYFGETITKELANCNGSETTSVGSFPPNAFGLYDTHGNVWEWCEDDWHSGYKGAPTDGSAWLSKTSSMTVIRGGSWFNQPVSCRSASRLALNGNNHHSLLGFRVACSTTFNQSSVISYQLTSSK